MNNENSNSHDFDQESTEQSKQPIRTLYLGHVTGYQPITDQYFLIRSVPDFDFHLKHDSFCRQKTGYVCDPKISGQRTENELNKLISLIIQCRLVVTLTLSRARYPQPGDISSDI